MVDSLLTIGNELGHRQFLDFPENLQFVAPCLKFPSGGKVKKWAVFSGRDCELEMQVFRPAPTPKALDQNVDAVANFISVGSNIVNVTGYGLFTFSIAESDQIQVGAGDVIGWRTSNPVILVSLCAQVLAH